MDTVDTKYKRPSIPTSGVYINDEVCLVVRICAGEQMAFIPKEQSVRRNQMIKSALLCLALTIYHESRGEPVSGQYAVAEVVVNRSQERNLSICDVVYEKNQFSWVKAHNSIPSNEVFNKSLQIADDVLNKGSVTNYSKGSNYFKQSRLANSKNNIKARIGGHIFY